MIDRRRPGNANRCRGAPMIEGRRVRGGCDGAKGVGPGPRGMPQTQHARWGAMSAPTSLASLETCRRARPGSASAPRRVGSLQQTLQDWLRHERPSGRQLMRRGMFRVADERKAVLGEGKRIPCDRQRRQPDSRHDPAPVRGRPGEHRRKSDHPQPESAWKHKAAERAALQPAPPGRDHVSLNGEGGEQQACQHRIAPVEKQQREHGDQGHRVSAEQPVKAREKHGDELRLGPNSRLAPDRIASGFRAGRLTNACLVRN